MVYIAFEKKILRVYKFIVQRIIVGKTKCNYIQIYAEFCISLKFGFRSFHSISLALSMNFVFFGNTKGISIKAGLKEKLQREASAKIMKIIKIFIVFFVFLFVQKKGAFRKLALIPSSQKKC